MIAEREREATDERARGREAAQRVTAVADRTYEETLSAAKRDALIIEGEADAERTRILAMPSVQILSFSTSIVRLRLMRLPYLAEIQLW